jgi:hypothetical protein
MWRIERTDEVVFWIKTLDDEAKEAILKSLFILTEIGPSLGRPYVDSVQESRHQNMKELRVQSKQRLFRIFFAFDPKREVILLIGGDKREDKRFYNKMVPIADRLFDRHLEKIKELYESKSKKNK